MFDEIYFPAPYFNKQFVRAGISTAIFKIDGENRGAKSKYAYLQVGTFKVDESLNNRNTASFILNIDPLKTDWRPEVGHEVLFDRRLCPTDPLEREFGGVIVSIDYRNTHCNGLIKANVRCADFHHILDRRVAFNIYFPQELIDVVIDICEQFLEGELITFDKFLKIPSIPFPKYIIPYHSVTKAFDEISRATGLFYYVDYFKRLHFFLRSEEASVVSISSNCPEDGRGTFCASIDDGGCITGIRFGDLKIKQTDSRVSNDQFVIAGQGTTRNEIVLNWFGDTEATSFVLSYKLAEIIDILVDDISVTFAERDEGDETADWFWTKGENQISQNEAGTPLGSGEKLTIVFIGFYDVVANRSDAPSIARFKNLMGGTGRFQRVHEDDTIESFDYADKYAKGLLKRFADVPVLLTYITDQHPVRVGQTINVNLPEYNVRNLSTGANFVVERVRKMDIAGQLFRYSITASDTDFQGGWQDFYRKLEKSGKSPKISANSKISFFFGQNECILIGVKLTVGDITDLKPHDVCLDPCLATGCGIIGKDGICLPEYAKYI